MRVEMIFLHKNWVQKEGIVIPLQKIMYKPVSKKEERKRENGRESGKWSNIEAVGRSGKKLSTE